MGLLDDAIREHLELKRLRGADPSEVAREEKDALGTAPRASATEQEDGQAEGPLDAGESLFSGREAPPGTGPSHTSQETVEINMDAELDVGIDAEHTREPKEDVRAAPVGHPAHMRVDIEESPAQKTPSGNSDEFGDMPAPGGDFDAEHMEGALEGMPDLLRDTPEQERLWFEQRPPRDLDFKE